MITQEIKTSSLRLFEETVVAMRNVANGCIADKFIVEKNAARLVKMVSEFRDNGIVEYFKYLVDMGIFIRSGNQPRAINLFERITN